MGAAVVKFGVVALCSAIVGGGIPLIIHFSQRRRALTHQSDRYTHHVDEKETICDICNLRMEDSSCASLDCKHVFHKDCLQAVFEQELVNSRICPYIDCRKPVNESRIPYPICIDHGDALM